MSVRVQVHPKLLSWACERSGLDLDAYTRRFPLLPAWSRGEATPTLKQLEAFARATHTPVGYLFLREPPEERIPLPDFRTMAARRHSRPSPDLLETIYICQQRQEWYRDFARSTGEAPLRFVGSATTSDDIPQTAAAIRDSLGFDLATRSKASTWTDALRLFARCADAAGVLVMSNGVVLNNNHRRLDPEEFRGFAIADELTPLVFINGADTKAAQMFTLAHELAHLWLGQTALSDADAGRVSSNPTERWCDKVAAELLVPLEAFRRAHDPQSPLRAELDRLARLFKVSTLVILRRIHDAGGLDSDTLWREYKLELDRLKAFTRSGGGGDFYRTQFSRVGERFARALVVSTLEGQTLYRDAFRMLGVSKPATFQKLSQELGVA